MKRIQIIISILLIILVESNYTQIIKSYGLKLGASNSEQVWNSSIGLDYSYISSIWGYDFSGYVEFLDIPYVSIISEIHYIQKGRTITINGTIVDPNSPYGYRDIGLQKTKQIFNYLSIPILAKFRYENSFIIPYLTIGPSFDFLISYPESELYNKFNKSELGIKVSAGINIPYKLLSILIMELGYNQSITNTYKNENVTIHNRGYSFSIGVTL